MKRLHGFTLVEVVVVISIITILAGIGVASYASTQRAARDKDRQADVEVIAAAMETYYDQNGSYPSHAQVALPASSEIEYIDADFGLPFLKQTLRLDAAALVAPGVDDTESSIIVGSNASSNPADRSQYVYYATSDNGDACTTPADWSPAPGYSMCEKFTLKYMLESDESVTTVTSKYGN